jgi:hypothetical protein
MSCACACAFPLLPARHVCTINGTVALVPEGTLLSSGPGTKVRLGSISHFMRFATLNT